MGLTLFRRPFREIRGMQRYRILPTKTGSRTKAQSGRFSWPMNSHLKFKDRSTKPRQRISQIKSFCAC